MGAATWVHDASSGGDVPEPLVGCSDGASRPVSPICQSPKGGRFFMLQARTLRLRTFGARAIAAIVADHRAGFLAVLPSTAAAADPSHVGSTIGNRRSRRASPCPQCPGEVHLS